MTESATIFDENGNKTYEVDSNGIERWYDSNGKLTRSKSSSSGMETLCEYDSMNRLIHYKNSNGLEISPNFK